MPGSEDDLFTLGLAVMDQARAEVRELVTLAAAHHRCPAAPICLGEATERIASCEPRHALGLLWAAIVELAEQQRTSQSPEAPR